MSRVTEYYNDQRINEKITTYSVHSRHGVHANTKVHRMNVIHTLESRYDLENAVTPIVTVDTDNSRIDSYGNIIQSIVHTRDNGKIFISITDNSYSNYSSQWHIGRLRYTITAHRSPDQPEQRRRVNFVYNDQGLLSEERVNSASHSILWVTRTRYEYNAHGQRTRTSVEAPGERVRTTTYHYDSEGGLQRSCNAYNECSAHNYDNYNRLVSKTTTNGITTSWQHDSFDRVIKESRADGTWTTSNSYFADSGRCGLLAEHAYSCDISHTLGGQPFVTQYDTLERELRIITVGWF